MGGARAPAHPVHSIHTRRLTHMTINQIGLRHAKPKAMQTNQTAGQRRLRCGGGRGDQATPAAPGPVREGVGWKARREGGTGDNNKHNCTVSTVHMAARQPPSLGPLRACLGRAGSSQQAGEAVPARRACVAHQRLRQAQHGLKLNPAAQGRRGCTQRGRGSSGGGSTWHLLWSPAPAITMGAYLLPPPPPPPHARAPLTCPPAPRRT